MNSQSSINQFEAQILVNASMQNESEWVTFRFRPISSGGESVVSFNYSIAACDSPQECTEYVPEVTISSRGDDYDFNVSLHKSDAWQRIYFSANYTLEGMVRKMRGATYSYQYATNTQSEINHLFFVFPLEYDITQKPDSAIPSRGSSKQSFRLDVGPGSNSYFIFEDTEEQKKIESDEKFREIMINIMIAVAGLFFGKISQNPLDGSTTVKRYKKHDVIQVKIAKRK